MCSFTPLGEMLSRPSHIHKRAGVTQMVLAWKRFGEEVSRSCERVFALLKVMFGDSQKTTLVDCLETSLMLRYNKRTIG